MNIDEFRTALREPPPAPLSVSVDKVVRRGRRRRLARRVGIAGTATVAVAAVAIGVPATISAIRGSGSGSAPAGQPAPAPQSVVSQSAKAPAPGTPTPEQSSGAEPKARPWGAVIRSGEHRTAGELIFWFQRVNEPQLPQTTFGLMVAHRDSAGRVDGAGVATNEVEGPDKAAGFHAGWYGILSADSRDWVAFGYYVGPVTRITATIKGRTYQARIAPWSVDPRVAVYWFSAGTGAPNPGSNASITRLAAYDKTGKPLPTGNTTVGVG
jgi:hypothetical protein